MARTLTVSLVMLLTGLANAADYQGDPDNYRELLGQLTAGDTLTLEPGIYLRGLPIHNLQGTANQPILIQGPAEGNRAILQARSGHNTISIVEASYVEIHNLEIDGQGLFADGVKAEGHSQYAHHITLKNLHIHNLGQHQQIVGISTKCPAWHWIVQDNIIEGAGTGMYFGDSDGSDPFIGGIIERNLVVNTIGYNLQVKHQNPRPDLSGIPQQPNRTVIRHNVFVKAEGGSSGPLARPNVLVGHWPLSGPGSEDWYEVYGNFFYQNPHESLFQGEGNIAFYNNLLVNHHGDALRIQPHNDIPRNIHVFFNTVVAQNHGITVIPQWSSSTDTEPTPSTTPQYPQTVVANASFAARAIKGGEQRGNIKASYGQASQYLHEPFAPLGQLDLYPKLQQLVGESMDMLVYQGFADWNQDFNGQRRATNEHFRGAYGGEGVNPGWVLQIARKTLNNGELPTPVTVPILTGLGSLLLIVLLGGLSWRRLRKRNGFGFTRS